MSIFAKAFNRLLKEDVAAATAFGSVDAGSTGNQFPAQNSRGYNNGDNRPIDPSKIVLGSKRRKSRKKTKIPVQRRSFSDM